jgi:hypothetical protein
MNAQSVSTWRKVLAGILDFVLIFSVAGYLIASFTGETTQGGFQLQGMSAIILFAIIVAYFMIGSRIGGTLFQRLLRTRG